MPFHDSTHVKSCCNNLSKVFSKGSLCCISVKYKYLIVFFYNFLHVGLTEQRSLWQGFLSHQWPNQAHRLKMKASSCNSTTLHARGPSRALRAGLACRSVAADLSQSSVPLCASCSSSLLTLHFIDYIRLLSAMCGST